MFSSMQKTETCFGDDSEVCKTLQNLYEWHISSKVFFPNLVETENVQKKEISAV